MQREELFSGRSFWEHVLRAPARTFLIPARVTLAATKFKVLDIAVDTL